MIIDPRRWESNVLGSKKVFSTLLSLVLQVHKDVQEDELWSKRLEVCVCACVPGLSSSRYDCTSIPCTVPSAATDLSSSPQHTERQAGYQKG